MQGNNVYKGFRYVPKNEGDWIKDNSYEALTVVQYQGNSYTSKVCVPRGIDILDTRFWTQTANYNQQFENLRDTFNTTTAETIKELNDFKNKQDNEFTDLLQSHKDNVNAYVDEMSKDLENERAEINAGGLTELNNNFNSFKNTVDSQFNDIEKKKANQYYVDIIKDYNAICDGVTDISEIVQKAIDDISASGVGGTIFIPKINENFYRFSNIILKRNVSIVSNGAYFKSIDSPYDMFKLDEGAITSPNYDLKIKGLRITANENNTNQIIFNLHALQHNGVGGGLWHTSIKDICIGGLMGNMIGLQLKASDSENNNIDVVNQYLRFNNINIYRKSNSSICVNIIGQLGQTTFKNCEFNGTSKDLGGHNVVLTGVPSSNDYLFGAQSFENVTIQGSSNGIKVDYASSLKIDGCWFEDVKSPIIIDNNTNLKLDNSHFANCGTDDGSQDMVVIGNGCRATGKNNYIIGPHGVFLNTKTVSTIHKGIDLEFNIHGSETYLNLRNTTPIIDVTTYKIFAYKYKTICVNQSVAIKLTEIQSEHTEGETITIVNINSDDTKYLKICSGINILMPNGINTIKLLENQSVTIKKISPIGKNQVRWIVISYTGVGTQE